MLSLALLVLLLVSGVGLQFAAGAPLSPKAYKANTQYRKPDAVVDGKRSFNAHAVNHYRNKRAFSPFMNAWKALIKTTFAFQKTFHDNIPTKTFLKIGSIDDAIADFYSLGPTRIRKAPGLGMAGRVNDEVEVFLNAPDHLPPSIYLMDTKTAGALNVKTDLNMATSRMIFYFKDMAEARSTMPHSWNLFNFRQ